MINDPLLFRVLNEVGIISQLSQTAFERVMPSGMTLAQFIVLNHLSRRGDRRGPADIARAIQVTKATMTSTLQKLVAKQLVDIVGDPRDARAKMVSLTDAGRAMRDDCVTALRPGIERLTQHWPEARAQALLPLLAELRAVLDADRERA